MKAIVKQVFKGYVSNPVFWVGIVIVMAGIYGQLHPYMQIHYITSEQEIAGFEDIPITDRDIMEGVILSSPEQQRETWESLIKDSLEKDFQMSEDEIRSVIHTIKNMQIEEACDYLEKEYGYYGAFYSYMDAAYHQGTMEEINLYLDRKMSEHRFGYYLSRKFTDFAGLCMGFFATIMLSTLYIHDTKKSNYELLHTKPISAGKYVLGKVLGGSITCCFVLGLLYIVFYAVSLIYTKGTGFEIQLWDFVKGTILYIMPNMIMIICIYTLIALLFKSPLPAVPLLFLYMVYSNMGSKNAEGIYGYYGKPLAIMVRFPGAFFETTPPPLAFFNQCILVAASLLIIFIAAQLWGRRRS